MLPEVLGADHFLNRNLERMDSGWMKSKRKSGKSDIGVSELERKQLRYILSTAPTWDRQAASNVISVLSLFVFPPGVSGDGIGGFTNSINVRLLGIPFEVIWMGIFTGRLVLRLPCINPSLDYRFIYLTKF